MRRKSTMTKKEQQERNRARRNLWTMNPVTRVKESGKAYNRKRLNQQRNDMDDATR